VKKICASVSPASFLSDSGGMVDQRALADRQLVAALDGRLLGHRGKLLGLGSPLAGESLDCVSVVIGSSF
jgi:hypothetical protein